MVPPRGGWKHLSSLKRCEGARKLLKLLWPPPPLRKAEFLPGVRGGEGHGRDTLGPVDAFQEERPQAPGQCTGERTSVPALLRHNCPRDPDTELDAYGDK